MRPATLFCYCFEPVIVFYTVSSITQNTDYFNVDQMIKETLESSGSLASRLTYSVC